MEQQCKKGKVQEFCSDIKSFLRFFLPKGQIETILFLGLFIFYFCIALYIAFTTSIIDNPVVETDLYFSFDNPLILKYGRSQINGHPLMVIFFYPFVIIGNLIAAVLGLKAKTILFLLLSSTAISLSCVYIYRYVREIVELGRNISLFFSLFFACFSTNLVLGFTPESFSLSAFFLSFSVYYYAHFMKKRQLPSFTSTAILSCFCLGGVTITNFSKGVIPVLFFRVKKIDIVKRAFLLGVVFFAILLSIHLFLYFTDGRNYFQLILFHKDEFINYKLDVGSSQYWMRVFSKFWGAPIFFPEIVNNTFMVRSVYRVVKSVDVVDYAFWWQCAYVGLLTGMIIISFIKNYANRFVQVLFLLLLVDIVIHCVFQFGLSWPFLYGGHWVYCIPLILAWLYKNLEKRWANVLFIIGGGMFVILLLNNLVRLYEFTEIAKEMYPLIK